MLFVCLVVFISVFVIFVLVCLGVGDLENGICVIYDDVFVEVYFLLFGGDV